MQKQKTEKYPQSDGNLALADESLVLLQQSQSRDALSFAGLGTRQYGGEDSEAETLGPATGIIVGIGLSGMLWCLIILIMFWIH
jgi:preprotein translocase subunit SecG